MARYTEAVCRLCRREGVKMFLKGVRCYTDKCSVERRKYAPGQHGQSARGKLSDYGVQLREKQKVRRMYGLLEGQFRKSYHRAVAMKGVTGANLLQLLELRLDNIVYRLGFAPSRPLARQLVTHGHFLVNGRKASIPSMILKQGSVVDVRESARKISAVADGMANAQHKGVPTWLALDPVNFRGTVQHLPAREEIDLSVQEQFIVELYSK